ncbi:protein LTV1-like protein [Cucumis melo var. makuwa]|uniref:Protein LTV1-like protein n=1 Tax=Cucumis melo var. makuwa TaxID=1194695 RepID=A0A5D3BJZ8_CUCMM|nr:protein LTV1-like protein [Cucumis melo var. makuwa]TYJ99457.1 protein LTV1-like protein [Cucumis melo var. makuwa]
MRREQEVPRRSNWLSKNFSCQCHPELKGTRFACYDEDPNSIFVDASEDYVEENGGFGSSMSSRGEIKNTCCGSTFNQNPKAKLNHVPCNEKNDFSKVNVDADENIYKVVSKIGVRVQNVVDSEIATLFDDDNMLFGFDG